MHKLYTTLVLLLTVQFAQAQIYEDILLFSDLHPQTTARSMGIGNATIAVGGDLSTLSANPAGLGIYRRNEVSASLGFGSQGVESDFFGQQTSRRKSQLGLGHLGAVFGMGNLGAKQEWRKFNFGISYNKIKNFNQSFDFAGTTSGSRVLAFMDAAQGYVPDNLNPFESGLAYDAYLLDLDTGAVDQYVSPLLEEDMINKSQTINRRGGINELAFSFAGNYKNKLYLGATLGISFLRFREFRNYRETTDDLKLAFEEMQFDEERGVDGTGINLKLGVIYRINKVFRVGASIHTPTLYGLREDYQTTMYGRVFYVDTLMNNEITSVLGTYSHRLHTPFQVSVGGMAIIAKKGFISLDMDYLNYSSARFSLSSSDADIPGAEDYIRSVNNAVEEGHQGAFRLRAGGEFVVNKYRIRLGYRAQSSPYAYAAEGVNDWRHELNLGLGYKGKRLFVDFAYSHTLSEFEYIPYATSRALQVMKVKQQLGMFLVTVGGNF